MNELETFGRWIVIGGVILLVVGGLIWAIGRFSGLSNLPGTIRIQGSGFTCLIPILGSIILSVVLTLILNIVARLFK